MAFRAALKAAAGFPEDDRRRGLALNGLATALLAQGQHEMAEETVGQAVEFWRQAPGGALPLATALHLLAAVQQRKGDPRAARVTLARALTLREAQLPADHPALRLTRKSLAALPAGENTAAPAVERRPLYSLHVASLKSASLAKAEWARLQREHGAQLQGLTMALEQADLGTRGVYQRVMAGAFTARGKAEALCQALQKKGQYCQVVLRGTKS